MKKKIFYSSLCLITLLALLIDVRTCILFFLFSALVWFFIERFEKKQVSLENQVLPFFSFTALIVILSSACSSLLAGEGAVSQPSLFCFLLELLIFSCALVAAALYVATCFRTAGKTSIFFLIVGISLILLASLHKAASQPLIAYFFFFGISRSFVDWLSQRFKFWLLIGILIGWAFVIGMPGGTIIAPVWTSGGLLASFFYNALISFILSVSVAFALYIPMSLILGSRKTRTKAATSYIFLSVIPIIILLTFLWLNFFLQVGIFELYLLYKDNIYTVRDLTNRASRDLEIAVKDYGINETVSQSAVNDICQKYEDFLSLKYATPSVFVTIFHNDDEKPVYETSSNNASFINPSNLLYPEWVQSEMMAWIFLENEKLFIKGVQFNNLGTYTVLVRLYVPLEFQNILEFEREYKLSIDLGQTVKAEPSGTQTVESINSSVSESTYGSSISFSPGEILLMINQGKIPLPATRWETGEYVAAGSITFSSVQYFSGDDSSPLYSIVLFGILLASSFLAFLVIMFSSVLGYIINRNMRKALNGIMDGVRHFASGDFDHRISLQSKDEYSIIAGTLNQMAIGIKRYTAQLIEKELMERELSIASEVQKQIFPQHLPVLQGFQFGIVSKPYGKVGGDYYDFITYQNGRLGVVIADASGKGIPAALMVSSLNAMLHSYMKLERPSEFLSIINTRLKKVATENAYITLVFCLFQKGADDIVYINAGHPYPLLLCENLEFVPLIKGGTSLGMFDTIDLEEGHTEMTSGETIIFVTDGILETTNITGDEFGMERLKEAVTKHHHEDAQTLAGRIFEELRLFSGSDHLADDATCIVIKKE